MKLHSLLNEDHVLVHGEGESLADVVRLLLDSFEIDFGPGGSAAVAAKIIDRERKNSSLWLEGFCFPHLRSEAISEFHLGLAVPEVPVSHPTRPDAHIRVVFLALAPQHQNTLLLQTLATLRRLASKRSFAPAAEGVRSPARLIRVIEESGLDVKRNLTAGDIMEEVQFSLDSTRRWWRRSIFCAGLGMKGFRCLTTAEG
jgi:mannitol/fructose-specific phosphotransferase system IIA component (Ntr-type)